MQALSTHDASFTDLLQNSTVIWNNTQDDDIKHAAVTNTDSVIVGLTASRGLLASTRLTLCGLIAIVILLGNALTLWAVSTTDTLRVKTYALTTSLAVADINFGVWLMIYVVHETMSTTPCDLATYKSAVRPFERFAIYASILHIAAIAVDRFSAVIHPLHYENTMTPSTIRSIIIIIWFVAAAVSMPPYFAFLHSIKPQSCIITLWPVFEAVIEVMMYSVNAVVIVLVYSKIWSTAMRHRVQHEHFNAQQQQRPQQRNACTGGEAAGDDFDSQNIADKWSRLRNLIWKHRGSRAVMVLLIMYVVLWFPYVLSRLLGIIVSGLSVTAMLLQTIGSLMGPASMAMNMFVYGIMNKEFRIAYKRILRVGTNVVHQQG